MAKAKRQYEIWEDGDGHQWALTELSDLHLLHIIAALRENRLFGRNAARSGEDLDARNWQVVMMAEAVKRGLDPDTKPTTKVPLIEWAVARIKQQGYYEAESNSWFIALARCLRSVVDDEGLEQPMVDVLQFGDHRGGISYLHWNYEHGMPVGQVKG